MSVCIVWMQYSTIMSVWLWFGVSLSVVRCKKKFVV